VGIVMTSITATSLSQAAAPSGERQPGLVGEIRRSWREFADAVFNPYRPELHYMRGPGPAWRAKHGAAAAGFDRTPR
jgi:hypothetical protein